MEKIKIVIADDHAIVREGISKLIEFEEDIDVVGVAENGVEAIKLCKALQPDVLLLDINMPKMNGIEVLKRIEKKNMNVKVLMLTIHNEKSFLVETISYGVAGYTLKDVEPELLFDAIRTVANGEQYIYHELKKYVDRNTIRKIKLGKNDLTEHLTRREVEVLALIAEGQNNKMIAANLYISEKTVKNHISSIFKKLGVPDRTTAALKYIKSSIKDA
ncbi:MAG: DNA-binding response regulator [Clostridiales bacterium]|nr:MAG: DNA-binding response regulator [Clostridiales bacterium]